MAVAYVVDVSVTQVGREFLATAQLVKKVVLVKIK